MSAHDHPAYEEELESLTEKLKGHERPDADPASGPSPNSAPRTPKPLYSKFTPIGGGRFHVTVERGALAHTDALRLASERQRLRFAQACDAKVPGAFAEVLSLLEREAVKQPFKTNPREDDGCRLLFTPASNFLPEAVDWVWENYIPAASVTILEGDPGVGKSLLLADLAARVSRGLPKPDRAPTFDEPGHDPELEPGLVWWFSGHDHPEQTLSPRLLAASADMNMIRIAEGIEDPKSGSFRPVSFPDDFLSLWKSRAHSPRLVIIDPLSAFTGGAHNHQAFSKALAQLALFARETSAAILIVHSSSSLRSSARSSSDPSAPLSVARSALLLANHPDDPSRKVLSVLKSNLCAPAPSLELEVSERRAGDVNPPVRPLDDALASRQEILPPCGGGGELASRWGVPSDNQNASSPTSSPNSLLLTHNSPLLLWHGPSPLNAHDLTRATPTPARSPFETRAVEAWLSEKLSTGPRLASDITSQAALDDIPPTLLRRARLSLNIIPSGANGHTSWRLPTIPPQPDEKPVHARPEMKPKRRSAPSKRCRRLSIASVRLPAAAHSPGDEKTGSASPSPANNGAPGAADGRRGRRRRIDVTSTSMKGRRE